MKKLFIIFIALFFSASCLAQIKLWRTPASQEWRDSLEAWGSERWVTIAGGGFVPYTGATADVNLGNFNLRAAIIHAHDAFEFADTDHSNHLFVKWGEDIVSDRSLILSVNDGSRTLTIPGDATISGTNTGDQTSIVGITGTVAEFNTALTGADFATGGGTASGTNTGDQAISNTSDATSHTATLSASGGSIQLVEGSGVTLTTTGTASDGIVTIASTGGYTDEQAQDAVGGILGNTTQITMTYSDAVPVIFATLNDGTVTMAKLANLASDRLIGRDAAGSGVPIAISVSGGIEFTGSDGIQTSAFTGDVTKAAGGTVTTIANDAVTYAKFQNISTTERILGRISVGAGDVEELTSTDVKSILSLSNVENTALSTWAGSTNITTVGTLTNGTIGAGFTAIANARLANSTISGVALGSNLADLTATDATLTFSGTYNGSTARTIGINLSNANTWTADQSVPDEAYGSSWNASVEVPTKNAIFDSRNSTAGVGACPTSSTTETVTHSLGRTPTIIRISGVGRFTSNNSATPTPFSQGIWNSSGNFCVYMTTAGTTTQDGLSSNTFAVFIATSAGNIMSGVIQNVGATTFDIVWTETGTAAALPYMWEAE